MIETRSQCIGRHLDNYRRDTGTSMPTLAQRVVEEYRERVPAVKRTVGFREEGDAFQMMKLNAQTLQRFFDGTCKLPSDLEEAIVFALPAERLTALRSELAARYDLLAVVKLPGSSLADRTVCAGMLAKEAGAALLNLSQVIADDTAGPQHEKLLADAVKELDALEAATAAVRATLETHQFNAATATRAVRSVR